MVKENTWGIWWDIIRMHDRGEYCCGKIRKALMATILGNS